MRRRRGLRTLTVAACGLALCGLASPASRAQEPAPGVVVAKVARVSFPLRVEALGTARANESIEIRSKVSETVTAIRFEEGQRVARGAVLVELEGREAKASVAAAKATLVDSESKFTRGKQLSETGLISASELESLEAKRDADRAALEAAESRLFDTVIRAPFAGRVGLRRVSLGALVGPGTVITTLDDTDTIKLDFDVPEVALSRLEEGLPVVAHSAAWPDDEFRGKVASVDTRVDPVSRTVKVRAQIPNTKQLLRPGMFLTVALLRQDVTALMVPEQSIVPQQSFQYVYVVNGQQVVEKREVQTGRRRPGQVEVLGGLTEGEFVISEGTQKAQPGEKVQILRQHEAAQ